MNSIKWVGFYDEKIFAWIFRQRTKRIIRISVAVLITGLKWCGKTTIAKQQCNDLKELQYPIFNCLFFYFKNTYVSFHV